MKKIDLKTFSSFLEFENAFIAGLKSICRLEVKNNQLYKNGHLVGDALDIFKYLKLDKNNKNNFFPAWIGFFAYEFNNYFLGKNITKNNLGLPDAFFELYEDGIYEKNYEILENEDLFFTQNSFDITCGLNKKDFFKQIKNIKNSIKKGDVYQVNLSTPFFFDAKFIDFKKLYNSLKKYNPTDYQGFLQHDDWTILSASPEKLFSLKNNSLCTRPIAGTKKRSHDLEIEQKIINDLKTCPKENAEHVMLVDLLRNDLNQVCEKNSVKVTEDRSIEFYSHVMHLVSEVTGSTDDDLYNIFKAIFPSGTITGAPKLNAINAIHDLETYARGPYTGALGYISSLETNFNILIRSIYKKNNQAWFNTGAGIVIDSNPESEWEEIHKKAQNIFDILQNKVTPQIKRKIIKGNSIFSKINAEISANVAFIENKDSFSFNIIDVLKSLGANIKIVSCLSEIKDNNFSHIVIGPGPGNPINMTFLQEIIAYGIDYQIPILGICLGHQALGYFFKSSIISLVAP